MTTDRTLLEDAARAAGHTLRKAMQYEDGSGWYGIIASGDEYSEDFDPQGDDGDSRRLQVACRITLLIYENAPPEKGLPRRCAVAAAPPGDWFAEEFSPGRDEAAAARLAVLRAAAAIGRQMKEAGCS